MSDKTADEADKPTDEGKQPSAFAQVLATELQAVEARRNVQFTGKHLRAMAGKPPSLPVIAWTGRSPELVQKTRKIEADALKENLFGLALSGGGIRSATFALGLLQSLAKYSLLPHLDYLSTVSGGGYIGSWLAAWIQREGTNPGVETTAVQRVQQQLNPSRAEEAAGRLLHDQIVFEDDPEPIHHLRSYSNYLTPRLGFFSADSWVLGAIYLRNLLLNQAAIVPLVLSLIILIRMVVLFYEWEPADHWQARLTILSLLMFMIAGVGISRSIWRLSKTRRGELKHRNLNLETWILHGVILVPLLSFGILWAWVAAFLPLETLDWPFAKWLDGFLPFRVAAQSLRDQSGQPRRFDAALLGIPLGLCNAFKYVCIWLGCAVAKRTSWSEVGDFLWGMFCGFVAGALFGGLLYVCLLLGFHPLYYKLRNEQLVASLGPPLVLALFVLSSFVEVGLQRENMDEASREWWSSLAGWIGIYSFVWLSLFTMALEGPPLFHWLGECARSLQGVTVAGWIGTTFSGVVSGKSKFTSGKIANRFDFIAYAGAAAFLVGLVIFLAVGVDFGLGQLPPAAVGTEVLQQSLMRHLLLAGVCFVVAVFVAQRVGVNTFSLQHMYANRLVRCYLGASRQKDPKEIDRPTGPNCNSPAPPRRPSLITGFDPKDDMPLADLQTNNGYSGPLLIINTALNLNRGAELAWQERKAESFVLTPYFSGSESTGYRPSEQFAEQVSLGTAVSISGAAVSPNMGYHTSPAISALLTVFNVRLGAWLGNPAKTWWHWNEPWFGMLHLLKELCGRTDASSDFIYLSDGGHFENLGIYELIRRRCRFILASDADEDGQFQFADLGGLVRKCRTDLGVTVDIKTGPIQDKDVCFAMGTIRYADVNPGAPDGLLLYVKPLVTSNVPVDVESYRCANSAFPHQSTLDQFFSESQFESYRMLGQHSITQLIGDAIAKLVAKGADPNGRGFVEALFQQLAADLQT